MLDDSILRKAEDIFYNKRFDFKDPNINVVINEIIGRLNSMRAVPENIKNLKCFIDFYGIKIDKYVVMPNHNILCGNNKLEEQHLQVKMIY